MRNEHISPIKTYKQFLSNVPLRRRIGNGMRDKIRHALSLASSSPGKGNWIRFPHYHHVFDDECDGFERQLRYMRRIGEFVSLDTAVAMLEAKESVSGRYFCITFDDGFKNSLTNALPILTKYNAHATFFLPVSFIGRSLGRNTDIRNIFHSTPNIIIDFLSWDDCRQILQSGMSVGSHSVNHLTLSSLSDEDAEKELLISKKLVEDKLGIQCHHFAAPVGIPGRDFIINRDPQLAKKIGYRSFLTGKRGSGTRRSSPMFIERDHVIAMWGIYALRYFFSK